MHLQAVDGGVKVVFRRKDGLVEFQAVLDFRHERLEFDVGRDLRVFDDDTAEAMEVAASVVEFHKWYFLNGRLRIDNAETGQLLSRKDAFLPLNVIVNPEDFDEWIARCRKEAALRRYLSGKVWRARVSPSNVSYSFLQSQSAGSGPQGTAGP